MIDIDSIKNNEERLLAKQQNTKEFVENIYNLTKDNCMFIDFKRCGSTRYIITEFLKNKQYQFLSLGYFTYAKQTKNYKYSFIISKYESINDAYFEWLFIMNHYNGNCTISNLKNKCFNEELFECLNNNLLNDKTFKNNDLIPFDKPCVLYARKVDSFMYCLPYQTDFPIIGVLIQ